MKKYKLFLIGLLLLVVPSITYASFCGYLRADTTDTLKIGPFVDSTDGDTVEDGLTLTQADIRLSKDGGNFAQKTEANNATIDELGYYDCPIDATDTNTEGRLKVVIHEAGALMVVQTYMVVNANVFDSLYAVAATDYLQVDVEQYDGVAVVDTVAGIPDVNVTYWEDDAVPAATDGLPEVNVVEFGDSDMTETVAGLPDVNVTYWEDSAVSDGDGVPDVDATLISASSATANKIESVFLGTGHTDDVDLSVRNLKIESDTDVALQISSSDDSAIKATSTAATKHGLELAGNTSGSGLSVTAGVTGHGIFALGGATSGNGIRAEAVTSGAGISCVGKGSGEGIYAVGGTTGHGIQGMGGDSVGNGIHAEAGTEGDGIYALGKGTDEHGILAMGGDITGDGFHAEAQTEGDGIYALAKGTTQHGILAVGGEVSGDGIHANATAGDGHGMSLVKHGTGKDLDAEVTDDILADTDDIGVAGAGLTNIDLPNQTMDITGTITTATNVGTVNGLAGNVITAASINDGAIGAAEIANSAIDIATFAADVGTTVYADNAISLATRKTFDELNLDHLSKIAVNDNDNMTTEVVDGTVLSNMLSSSSDTSTYEGGTDSHEAIGSNLNNIANVGSAINKTAASYTLSTGTQSANAYTDTIALNGTRHTHTDVGNEMDLYYEFHVGGGIPSSVTVTGTLTGVNDDLEVKAYDWIGTAWVQIGILDGITGTANRVFSYDLMTSMVGTGADIGKVRIKFVDGDYTLSTATLYIDQIFVSFSQGSGDYNLGAIWVDTGLSNTNTVSGVDGTSTNPVSSWAAALTLSANLNINKFHIANGSTITLSAASENFTFVGNEWTLDLGGRSIAGSHFEDANVTGISSGSGAHFIDCTIGDSSFADAEFTRCNFSGTTTLLSAATYLLVNSNATGGVTPPVFDVSQKVTIP